MADIKIGDKNYNIERMVQGGEGNENTLYYDVNGNGELDAGDEQIFLTKEELARIISDQGLTGTAEGAVIPLDTIIQGISSDDVENGEVAKMLKDLQSIRREIGELEKKLETLEAQPVAEGDAEEAAAAKKGLEETMASLKSRAQTILDEASMKRMSASQKQELVKVAEKLDLQVNIDDSSSTHAKAGTDGSGRAAQQQPKAGGAWGPQQSQFGFQWGSGQGGKAGFDMNAYLNSSYMDQSILNGYDSVNKNVAEQKKMMQLFFYFAKMAMSGDMGAMYRFMQFITYIISKDKAMQNIHMATKLIEMEDSSRAALQELLDTPTPESGDQTASFEFTKVMERTKQHQSSLATSQKLVAQMMEEMAQVTEALTNLTKSAFDSYRRQMQAVTRPS